ncbi:Abitram-like protein [Drosera capensis]
MNHSDGGGGAEEGTNCSDECFESVSETCFSQQQNDKQDQKRGEKDEEKLDYDEDEVRRLLAADVSQLPASPPPPSIVETNFDRYFAPDFMKPGHDQYVYRHANGLCVIGLAPFHVALQAHGGVTSVDFNVGKSDRSELKVTGKRKKNAQQFESNTALCKVISGDTSYVIRCCVKGSLLEVNNRLMNNPDLLNTLADRDGYIAIIQPKLGDWLKAKQSLLDFEGYKKLRSLS